MQPWFNGFLTGLDMGFQYLVMGLMCGCVVGFCFRPSEIETDCE